MKYRGVEVTIKGCNASGKQTKTFCAYTECSPYFYLEAETENKVVEAARKAIDTWHILKEKENTSEDPILPT